jgi:DNA-binding PadR family transcriptional regulator
MEVRPVSLGDLEQLVLLAIVRLGGEAHGAPIIEEIETATGRNVAPGALYTVLGRLDSKGLVESWIGDATPERGGRRKRVYRILPAGALELRRWYDGLQKLAVGSMDDLDRLVGEQA